MTQEIEIEFKNLVTKVDFYKLINIFKVDASEFESQKNYYFDTADFQLKMHNCALRIREKNSQYTLTLKQPNKIGLLETHQTIDRNQAEKAFQGCPLPKGTVANQLLTSFQIDITPCRLLGSLATSRAEKPYSGGILVFDHSIYLDVEDYEIEYEVTEEHQGKSEFERLFSENNIPIVHTDNKIKRFFLRKQSRKA
ncbi:CYTH domain-containing protein [Bacillaceae bacterium IKA-2]|nr:CYTH domain-containing protein [Bacillaceae bacterium IKA-2]